MPLTAHARSHCRGWARWRGASLSHNPKTVEYGLKLKENYLNILNGHKKAMNG
jgi:hypothetical protein